MKGTLARLKAAATKPQDAAWEHRRLRGLARHDRSGDAPSPPMGRGGGEPEGRGGGEGFSNAAAYVGPGLKYP